MDCLQARQIVSEAFDRGVADTPGVAEARVHCRDCAECKAFVEGLVALQKAPAPGAPPALVDEILGRVRLMAELDTPAKPAAASAPEPAPPAGPAPPAVPGPVGWEPDIATPTPPRPREKWWWVPRATAIVTAAAIVIVALVMSVQGFRGLASRGEAGSPSVANELPMLGGSSPEAGAPQAAAPTPATGESRTADSASKSASTVRYVAFEGQAYVWLGERTPDRSTIEAAGTLSSSLDGTTGPITHQVWRSKTDAEVILIEPTPGSFVAFRRVTRTLGGHPFALSAERGVGAYGEWPTLPDRFATPSAPDGGPTFVEAGTEDTGLTVYAPPGVAATEGFAVAPGTSATDPAAGNPNWTWWVPIR